MSVHPRQGEPVHDPEVVVAALLRACHAYPEERVAQVIVNALGPNPFYVRDEQAALALNEYANEAWDQEVNP